MLKRVLKCSLGVGIASGQSVTSAPVQTETDEYTRYELLAPETSSSAMHYEVTASHAGARYYYNPIRKGSVAGDESIVVVATREPLRFEVVSGAEATKDPLMKGEDTSLD
jgi:hypothetical protein